MTEIFPFDMLGVKPVLKTPLSASLLVRLDSSDALLMARYTTGYSCRGLAEALGISRTAVRKRLSVSARRAAPLPGPAADESVLNG